MYVYDIRVHVLFKAHMNLFHGSIFSSFNSSIYSSFSNDSRIFLPRLPSVQTAGLYTHVVSIRKR